ncbi:ATP-dependent zinc metalloprotease YME1L isoform X2 [Athalia rosae]|uniref:ATP-dependent zinc metalloprotease YME1L isoform X2 n=1 Tax=Athalia rosae TaxID=37344 RepID=UPI0020348113|nr:ATP-dependent zinc metalloprotease YME1L isoform X2 [Athalia rosae]
MISLQSHNQVLFHLTQLTSAVTPRRAELARAKSRVKSNNEKDILCYKSLAEAANNCTEFPLERLNIQNLGTALQVNRSEVLEILKHISRGSTSRFQSSNNKWKISYLSGNSFDENKQSGLICRHNFERHRILQDLCTRPLHLNAIIRGFKTERNVKAELGRNPSFSGRVRRWLGLSPPVLQFEKLGVLANGVETPQVEKLRSMLTEGEMSPSEQQRIKVAFAEGYLAGHGQNYPVRTRKWYKVIQQIFIFGLLLGVLGSFFASSSGTMFRIQLGNQVEVDPEDIDVKFSDVKGADEAKQELKDVVEFLKNPEKFSVLGGKLPKGVLLVGPPGTGKTLLARAVAGEAGVPFFHAAGPEFDEILVGQGARRVRDLFKAAKERAPCVLFIDEIDSVGAKRTNSVLHPYANQTINQLLSEMDGFHQNEGVIVLGATNRRDDLDTALLRPGRFDVEVTVPTPDFSGRKEILELYLGRVLSRDVNVEILARGTTGFTGADLENMVNQAALRAAIDGAECVSMKHLENARDKVLMGPERKARLPDEEANLITAYHEGGHAIVAYFTKDSHPLHKVTIMPRGKSLGHTAYIPEKDIYHTTKQHLLAMMDTMMGGRAAEELVFGPDKITSGASNDLQRATSIALAMVKEWGMSEKVGLRTHNEGSKSFITVNEVSPNSQELIDSEVKRLMQESYERAKTILKAHAKEHKQLAEALIKYETLDAEDVKAIMTGQSTHEKPTKKTVTEVPKNVM